MNPRQDDSISAGMVLVDGTMLLPAPFTLGPSAAGASADSWPRIGGNGDVHELERALSVAGWNMFYMAGTISADSFGFARPGTIHAALQKVLSIVRRQNCNCIEIDRVENHSFWGIPFVRISAHARRIQEGQRAPRGKSA